MENITETTIENQITALLFWKGEPLSVKKIADTLSKTEDEIVTAIAQARERLNGTGISLVQNADEVVLVTSPEHSELIDRVAKEELSRDLGRAGLETISVIAYRGPIKRSEIDYIRGVSSSTIVRNLMVRGLIERAPGNDNDARGVYYQTTTKLLEYLGVNSLSELPEYQSTRDYIEKFEKQENEDGTVKQ